MRAITKYYCKECKELLLEYEYWGFSYPKILDKTNKEYCIEKHKFAHSGKYFDIFKEKKELYPFIQLQENIIGCDDSDNLAIMKVDKIIYKKTAFYDCDYYFNDNGVYRYINFPSYSYIYTMNPQEIIRLYYNLAFINNQGLFDYFMIYNIYSVLENDIKRDYVNINKNLFEVIDLYNLSQFLKEFDEINIENSFERLGLKYIEKRLNDFKEFKDYWMKKYYIK